MEKLQPNLFFPFAGVAAVASFASCSNKQKPVEQKPLNIVYIMTDDHTAQMMSCYDTRYMETPNLDRIAADGVRFTQSFVANSLSGPSRACSLLFFPFLFSLLLILSWRFSCILFESRTEIA